LRSSGRCMTGSAKRSVSRVRAWGAPLKGKWGPLEENRRLSSRDSKKQAEALRKIGELGLKARPLWDILQPGNSSAMPCGLVQKPSPEAGCRSNQWVIYSFSLARVDSCGSLGEARGIYVPLAGAEDDDGTASSRRLLARMDRMEDFAAECDRFEELHADEFQSWELPALKLHFANTYRRLVGVDPSERHALRSRLHIILQQAHAQVTTADPATLRLTSAAIGRSYKIANTAYVDTLLATGEIARELFRLSVGQQVVVAGWDRSQEGSREHLVLYVKTEGIRVMWDDADTIRVVATQ